MRLKNPGGIDQAIQTINEWIGRCQNTHSSFHDIAIARDEYLQWADQAYDQFNNHFHPSDLADGLFSERYWAISRLEFHSARPYDLIRREMRTQTERLAATVERLHGYKQFTGRPGHIVVPDTSAFTRGENFVDFDWPSRFDLPPLVRLVVPILVVEELDKVKWYERRSDAAIARRVIKDLRSAVSGKLGRPVTLNEGTTIEVFIDDDGHERLENFDAEIISQALFIHELTGRPVTLTCVDASMEFRAQQRGLAVISMPERGE